jgi:translation initiation factor 2D
MFKKPPSNIKSYSPLRSSDRRKFRDEILRKFPLLESSLNTLVESSTATDTTDATDTTSTTDSTDPKAESPLNTIVPEHTQSAKFTSNLDVHGVIYVTKEKQPIWFKKDKDKNEILVPSGNNYIFSFFFLCDLI